MTAPATPLPNLIAALGEAAAEIMEAAAHGDGAARWTARPEAIRTLAYGVPALLAAWNRRAQPPGQAALVDALREIVAVVDGRADEARDAVRPIPHDNWTDIATRLRAALSAVADGADAAGVG